MLPSVDPVQQLQLVTSYEQAVYYDTLVYEPATGRTHVRMKGDQEPAHGWAEVCATAAVALEAANARGLQPTAIFYVALPDPC